MRIVFYANSKVAIPAFQYLAMNRLVVGLCLSETNFEQKSHFLEIAQWSQIPVLEVNRENIGEVTVGWFGLIQPTMGMVFTFPYKIQSSIFKRVENGFYNIHFGKLPEYRGAEPLFWNMVNKEREICITIHKMTSKFDAGPIVMEENVSIEERATYGAMQFKLAEASVRPVSDFLHKISNKLVTEKKQEVNNAKSFAKPQYSDVRVNWEKFTAIEIEKLIKAVNPWNKGVITYCDKRLVKILLGSKKLNSVCTNLEPGQFEFDKISNQLTVATIDGSVLEVQALYVESGFYNAKEFWEMTSENKFFTELSVTV